MVKSKQGCSIPYLEMLNNSARPAHPSLLLRFCAFCTGVLLLVGCTSGAEQAVVTPLPEDYLPTIIAETASASIQLSAIPSQATAAGVTPSPETVPTSTLAPTALVEDYIDDTENDTGAPPSAIEALDVTAPPVIPELISEGFVPPTLAAEPSLPPATIKIYRPGDLSRVVSPFSVVANVPPGMDNHVLLELIGEDGRTLEEINQFINPQSAASTANLLIDIRFKIEGVAEAGRLQLSLRDIYGRLMSVTSVNLVLLSTGINELKGYGDLRENITIRQPGNGEEINGGRLVVSGAARTGNDEPLLIELIDQQGNVVGAGQAAQDQPIERNFYTYTGEVAYTVSEATPVRLVVHANGARIPGTAFLNSIELVLLP